MAQEDGMEVLTEEQWAVLQPLIEECRPKGKTQHHDLRRTIEAILWRHQNGAKWRAVPVELGPWWMAAQTFIRWAKLGIWERLIARVQEDGVALGMTFLDGTHIRAHSKAAGAAKKGRMEHGATCERRLAALVAGMEQRLA
jgi:transposase